jgi:hypothetical protein
MASLHGVADRSLVVFNLIAGDNVATQATSTFSTFSTDEKTSIREWVADQFYVKVMRHASDRTPSATSDACDV